ncbi:MAG TPA: hypothetical protein VF446_02570 [Trinickia sp.]
MLRVLCVMLLAGSSIAYAGEHYREVWNPPEARHATHASHHANRKPAAHPVSAKRSAKAKPPHVAARVHKPARRQRKEARAASENAVPQAWDRPPVYTPEGNVLRVDSRGAIPEIAR